mmetsp:Transcript_26027/g.50636  ORF Transcript_26027/g.50636 Transcript_26027/m.50636 type:complete len:258 (-) Transcript_26027:1739-2512(-)
MRLSHRALSSIVIAVGPGATHSLTRSVSWLRVSCSSKGPVLSSSCWWSVVRSRWTTLRLHSSSRFVHFRMRCISRSNTFWALASHISEPCRRPGHSSTSLLRKSTMSLSAILRSRLGRGGGATSFPCAFCMSSYSCCTGESSGWSGSISASGSNSVVPSMSWAVSTLSIEAWSSLMRLARSSISATSSAWSALLNAPPPPKTDAADAADAADADADAPAATASDSFSTVSSCTSVSIPRPPWDMSEESWSALEALKL